MFEFPINIKDIHSVIPSWANWILLISVMLSLSLLVLFSILAIYDYLKKKKSKFFEKISTFLFASFIVSVILGPAVLLVAIMFYFIGILQGILALLFAVALISAFCFLTLGIGASSSKAKKIALWSFIAGIIIYILALIIGHYHV